MSQPLTRAWSTDEFFAWQERQDSRYELVGGTPVRMMAGARRIHDRIVVNLLAALHRLLRGGPCSPFTGDGSVETYPGQIRRPDAGVECGPFDPAALRAAEPRMVAEVLSPSTRGLDGFVKLAEYQGVASMDYVLIVEPNAPDAVLWSRSDEGWSSERMRGLDGTVRMPRLGVTIAAADLYEGVTFPAAPDDERA